MENSIFGILSQDLEVVKMVENKPLNVVEKKEVSNIVVAPVKAIQAVEMVVINPKEFGLGTAEATEIESVFIPVIAERKILAEIYSQIIGKELSEELTIEARDLRLKLVKVRTSTDKIHKTAKAFYLAGGKFVDAWKNSNVTMVAQMEAKLSEIENYYINIEKAEKAALLSTRKGLLMQYCDDTSCYNLVEMTNEMFLEVLAFHKQKYDEKMEVCRLAEIERERMAKGREEEQKRIAEENRALKATLAIEKEKTDKLQAELKERDIVAAKPIETPFERSAPEKKITKFDTLKKIVAQLEQSNYSVLGCPLKNDLAFIALKQMAEREVE